MEKTTDIGIRPKSFEGNCGTCVTSCLSEAEQLLNKFSTVGVYRNYESLIFSSLDIPVAALGHISLLVPPTHHAVSFNVFHLSPTYTFEKPFSRETQRYRDSSGFDRYPPWCPRPAFGPDRGDSGRDLLLSRIKVFCTYDRYDLGIHCGDLTVQDSGSQFDVRTRDWGQDGIRGSRSPIDHNIFYLLLKTTCENKGFTANTSNHPHVVSTPSMYGSLTDRNSYIQKEKISANLSRKTFMYQLGEISKWETCDNCAAITFSNNCPNTVTKYTLGDSPLALNRIGRGSEVFDTEQEAVDAVKLTPPKIFIGQVITPPQPREQLSKAYGSSFGIYPAGCGTAAYCRSPDHLAIGCKSQLQTWGWVDGGSYYEQVSTRQSWAAGCTGPVGEFGEQPDPTGFRCGQRKWQPYGYIAPSTPMPNFGMGGYTPPPPYLGCRSQKGHILSANGLVDTNLNQFTLSTPNDLVDLSSCDVSMASLLVSNRQSVGQDLVGMAFYSAPIIDAAANRSHDFNFQEIYKREFSWKNLNPTMEPFDADITASM